MIRENANGWAYLRQLFLKHTRFSTLKCPFSFTNSIKITGNKDGFRRNQEATGSQGPYCLPQEVLHRLNCQKDLAIDICRLRETSLGFIYSPSSRTDSATFAF